MQQVTSLAFYKFVHLSRPRHVADEFRNLLARLEIKGTLIFANEGVNGSIAGPASAMQTFIEFCSQDVRFSSIHFKKSKSSVQPFRRLLVKVKSEIVTMGKAEIKPEHFTGEYVRPSELKQWLDSGSDLIMLDTRNDYEVRLGTFKNALDPNIKTFRTFPNWVEKNLSDKKDTKIVTFCTGGIRCEKATAFMRQQGFNQVYQLQGGILNYFEETQASSKNASHFQGDCFVFDYRVAVDKNLTKTSHEICFACWQPLTPEQLSSPLYEFEKSCPHCASQQTLKTAALREKQIRNNHLALLKRQERSARAKAQRMGIKESQAAESTQ